MPARKRGKQLLIERLQWLTYEFEELGVATVATPPICYLMELARHADPEGNQARPVKRASRLKCPRFPTAQSAHDKAVQK